MNVSYRTVVTNTQAALDAVEQAKTEGNQPLDLIKKTSEH